MRIAIKYLTEDEVENGPPGSFALVEKKTGGNAGMVFQCPCGCGNVGWLAFDDGENPHPCWKFDGNLDAPTLHPSVFNSGLPCKWHGWLRAGQWVGA